MPDAPRTDTGVANQLILFASVVEADILRYTPSGVPALDVRLEHASEVSEVGQVRQVKATIQSVALGTVAERLVRQEMGSVWRFVGFLATPRGTRRIVFHIQDFSSV